MSAARAVVVTGVHSGPNPSPGLGVARSLRSSREDLLIVGLDYSSSSSGLHDPVFDETVVFPSWDEVDLKTWEKQIRRLIEVYGTIIPCLDLEVHLLARMGFAGRGALSPSESALMACAKPSEWAAETLGFCVPATEFDGNAHAVESFMTSSPAGAWVKGPNYEAFRAHTRDEALERGQRVEQIWGSWYLERHVAGEECAIGFSAERGKLQMAVMAEKLVRTAEGKTWSATVDEIDPGLLAKLERLVRELGWTGGGELEFVRPWAGQSTLIDFNPRFPAWINGASVSGFNLPGALIGERRSGPTRRGFTRVVAEIPLRGDLAAPHAAWIPDDRRVATSKHPSGMSFLARRGVVTGSRRISRSSPWKPAIDLANLMANREIDGLSPSRTWFPELVAGRIVTMQERVGSSVKFAYSVKTCPNAELMAIAANHGMYAEAITNDEQSSAEQAGFVPGRVILNGPAKWWPSSNSRHCEMVFADSLSELRNLSSWLDDGFDLSCRVIGLRTTCSHLESRFGEPLESADELSEAGVLLRELSDRLNAGWGLHFHHAQSSLGTDKWKAAAASALSARTHLARIIGREPAVIDIGGGWSAAQVSSYCSAINQLEAELRQDNSGALEIVAEPGKLLVEGAAALVTTVIGTRGSDAIVDACISELPQAQEFVHPVASYSRGRWGPASFGSGRILGRSCMESDVLGIGLDLAALQEGDLVAIGNCGAYDASMSYEFGRGAPVV